jgi:hypothetical protein
MRPTINLWKTLSIALSALVLVLLFSSRVEPTRADSANSHYVLTQGMVQFGVTMPLRPNTPVQTVFRLDTTSGEVFYLSTNANGTAYQWAKIAQ